MLRLPSAWLYLTTLNFPIGQMKPQHKRKTLSDGESLTKINRADFYLFYAYSLSHTTKHVFDHRGQLINA